MEIRHHAPDLILPTGRSAASKAKKEESPDPLNRIGAFFQQRSSTLSDVCEARPDWLVQPSYGCGDRMRRDCRHH